MNQGINVLSCFDGISCGQIALERAGIKVNNYYASEVDKYAIKVTQANYPNTIQLGDIKELNAKCLPKIDLLIGGFPCTNFSFAGKQNGMSTKSNIEITNLDHYLELKKDGFEFEGQSYLFWEYVRLLKEVKPKYFLLENVKMSKKWEKVLSEAIGVEPILINSSLLSAQNRKRLYWTNIPNVTLPMEKNITLSSVIGDYDGIWVYPRGYNKGGVQQYKGKCPTITISSWQHNFFIYKDGEKIKFTVRDAEAVQTIPENYIKDVSDNQAFKMIGNGWTVDVIVHIFNGLKNKMEN